MCYASCEAHSTGCGAQTEVPLSSQCRALLQAPHGLEIPAYDDSFRRIKSLIMCGVPLALAKIDAEQVREPGAHHADDVKWALGFFRRAR
jgi:hypothetical protein